MSLEISSEEFDLIVGEELSETYHRHKIGFSKIKGPDCDCYRCLAYLAYKECKNVKPKVVGYCRRCKIVMDPYPGSGVAATCDMEDDSKDTSYYHHRYHKRLMWRCPGLDTKICDYYFASRKELLEHEHGQV